MEHLNRFVESQQSPSQQPLNIKLGIVPYDEYNSILKVLSHNLDFLTLMLPNPNIRIKHQLELLEKSVLSSNTYRLLFKHNNKPLLYCSKQLFGKYVFYSKTSQERVQEAYMSKYGSQYKLYLKKGNDKIELAYFIIESQQNKDTSESRILIPITQNLSHIQGIRSNNKKQSEIKWRWSSKSKGIASFKIVKIEGNLLKMKYIYVSKGETMNEPKMVMKENEENVWEYFIENPLTVLQGFALGVLLVQNFYK